jgi:hypothetical protein
MEDGQWEMAGGKPGGDSALRPRHNMVASHAAVPRSASGGSPRRRRVNLQTIRSTATDRRYSQTGRSGTVGRAKSKNCKTNPSLSKPAWKIVPDKAKNEPKFQGLQSLFWSSGGVKMHGFGGLGAAFRARGLVNQTATSSLERALTGGVCLVECDRRFPP